MSDIQARFDTKIRLEPTYEHMQNKIAPLLLVMCLVCGLAKPIHADISLDGLLGSMSGVNSAISGLSGSIGSIANTMSGLSSQVDSIVAAWNQTNTLIGQVINPASALIAGAAGGAGFALGGIAVSGAAQLVKMAFIAIHEAITHQKRNEKVIHDFLETQKHYQEASEAIRQSELSVSSLFDMIKSLQHTNQEEFLEQLNQLIWLQEQILQSYAGFAQKLLKRSYAQSEEVYDENVLLILHKAHHETPYFAMLQKLIKPAATLDDLLRKAKELRKFLEKNPHMDLCVYARQELGRYRIAEQEMQRIRVTLIDNLGRQLFHEGLHAQAMQSVSMLRRANDIRETFKRYQRGMREAKSLLWAQIKSNPKWEKSFDQLWRVCLHLEGSAIMHTQETSYLSYWAGFTSTSIRSKCRAEARKSIYVTNGIYPADMGLALEAYENTVKHIEADWQAVYKGQAPIYDPQLEQQAQRAYREWHQQLRDEQTPLALEATRKKIEGFEANLFEHCPAT